MTRFWNLKNDPEIPEDGVLDIDGEIEAERGWFTSENAVIAKDFRKALAGMKNVIVHINSPGGDVMAGAEIYSALREHSMNGHGKVTVIVTALAASAASVIAMAGDEILMSPTAYMMIHNPWSLAIGDAHEMRKVARTLDVLSEGLINAYEQRTGKSRDELKRMLEAETWMSAGTAVEQGFADGILGSGEAGKAVACLMGMKAHGAAEIAARYLAEEKPDEETEEEEERPESDEEDPEETDRPGADPEEDDPEDEDPEEENPNDPEEEDPDEEEARAEIARRATILASLY